MGTPFKTALDKVRRPCLLARLQATETVVDSGVCAFAANRPGDDDSSDSSVYVSQFSLAHDKILSELPLAWMAEVKSVGPICICAQGFRVLMYSEL
jgi:hypothetical protein